MTKASDEDHTGATIVAENPDTGERFNIDLICRMTEARIQTDARRIRVMRALLALDHPVFPMVHEFTVWEGYLSMRWTPPRALFVPLETALGAHQPFTEADLRAATEHASRALGLAHDLGVFHGALDPEHILLSLEGDVPLVIGLGVAQLRFEPDETGALPPTLSREHDMASLMATMASVRVR